jgi:hypothetical protein
MGEKSVRIRQPDRNDDVTRRADPERGLAPLLWSEFCSREFPSSTQDAGGLRGSSGHIRRANVSDGVRSPQSRDPAGLVGSSQPNAPLHVIVGTVCLERFEGKQIRTISAATTPLYRFHQWQANLRVLEVTKSIRCPVCLYPIRL